MSTAVNTMTNLLGILGRYAYDTTTNGVTILENAVRGVTTFGSLQNAIDNFVADTTSTETYADVNERLKATSGIVLGADDVFTVDTGAISGYNAGGEVVKDARTIVPESALVMDDYGLPAPNSTTTHTYTGADGKTFTFYAKWPINFTQYYDCTGSTAETVDSYYHNDANLTDMQDYTFSDGSWSISAEDMQSGLITMVKGLYNFWLEESFKLAYDSYGLDFDGKTIDIRFVAGGISEQFQAATGPYPEVFLPSDNITMAINLPLYAVIDPSDANGFTRIEGGFNQGYLDRTIAHELIHAVMFGTGTLKKTTPEFFGEGIADLVMGSDDYDSGRTEIISQLAESYDDLAAAMSLDAGTGTTNRYVSGYMFLRYLAQHSLNVNPELGSATEPITYSYDGGATVISDYKPGDKILYTTDLTSVNIAERDIQLSSSSGGAIIRDARDKLINLADANGNINSYAYIASNAENVDGSYLSGFEIAVGGDDVENVITAGSGGSFLWGGNGDASDILVGGAGSDEFYYYLGNGNDIIQNANSEDIVKMPGISMSQITSANVSDGVATLNFNDGGSLQVSGDGQTKYEVENQIYTYDSSAAQWTKI